MRPAWRLRRGHAFSLLVVLLVSATVLLVSYEYRQAARDQLFEATRRIFVVAADITARGLANGYFEWTELRELLAADRTAEADEYLGEIPRKFRFVTAVHVERTEPPPGRTWEYEARGEDLDLVFPISDSGGENPLLDRRAVVRLNAAALLREVQSSGAIRLTTSGGQPLAYGLVADFRDPPLHPGDWPLALMIGVLAGLPAAILATRQSRFFYESKGLETIIYLFERTERYSANHSRNVAALAAFIGTHLGLRGRRLRDLYAAALLHDIGKISTPPEILIMPRALEPGERDTIKQHPEVSASILSNFSELAHLAEFARCHHERLDGSGYPDGLGSADIPLESRIIAIADVFEALTGERPYRSALPPEGAFGIMEKEAFDPDIFALFRSTWPAYASFKLPHWAIRWTIPASLASGERQPKA